MKKIVLSLTIALLFINACCKERKYIIPEKEQFKMQLLDTIIFKSDSLNIDTLYINSADEEITPESFPFPNSSTCSDNDWYQSIWIRYYLIKNGRESEYFYIYQRFDEGKSITSIKHNNSGEFIEEYRKFTLNGIEYKKVQEYSCNNDILKFYANPEYGILSYERNTGEIFYLDKYINAD